MNASTYALLLAGLVTIASPPALASTATLTDVRGAPNIFEISQGRATPVSLVARGHAYELPIEVETGANDAASFTLPNSFIEVAPNTMMRIVSPEPRDVGIMQRVLQQSGSALFSVQKGSVDRFQVETPFLVSVVKGTIFNVLVDESGATVALHEGRLLVTSIDGTKRANLEPGGVAFAGRDGQLFELTMEPTQAGAVVKDAVSNVPADTGPLVTSIGAGAGLPGAVLPQTLATVDATASGAGAIAGGIAIGTTTSIAPVVASVVDTGTAVVQSVTSAVGPLVGNTVGGAAAMVGSIVDGTATTVTPVVASAMDTGAVVLQSVTTAVDPLVGGIVDSTASLIPGIADPMPATLADTPLLNTVVDGTIAPITLDDTTTLLAPILQAPPVDTLTGAATSPGVLTGGLLGGLR